MPIRISPNGENWAECPDELFGRLLRSPVADCYVDVSDLWGSPLVTTLAMMRRLGEVARVKE